MKRGFAQRVDDNQKQIVRELAQIPGVSVTVIGQPVDLLVGFKCKNFLFELKQQKRRNHANVLTPNQKQFMRDWRGQVQVVSSTLEILQTLKLSYAHETVETDENTSVPNP